MWAWQFWAVLWRSRCGKKLLGKSIEIYKTNKVSAKYQKNFKKCERGSFG